MANCFGFLECRKLENDHNTKMFYLKLKKYCFCLVTQRQKSEFLFQFFIRTVTIGDKSNSFTRPEGDPESTNGLKKGLRDV